jgi:hypothetical protein
MKKEQSIRLIYIFGLVLGILGLAFFMLRFHAVQADEGGDPIPPEVFYIAEPYHFSYSGIIYGPGGWAYATVPNAEPFTPDCGTGNQMVGFFYSSNRTGSNQYSKVYPWGSGARNNPSNGDYKYSYITDTVNYSLEKQQAELALHGVIPTGYAQDGMMNSGTSYQPQTYQYNSPNTVWSFTIYGYMCYGVPPIEATPTPEPTQNPCYDFQGTPISDTSLFNPEWVAQCSSCLLPTPTPTSQYQLTKQPIIGATVIHQPYGTQETPLTPVPTNTPMPTATMAITPTLADICKTPPFLRDSTPVVSEDWADLIISTETDCYDLIIQKEITIPGFLGLWQEFSAGWDGWQLCVHWVQIPEMRILSWVVPTSVITIGLVIFLFKVFSR